MNSRKGLPKALKEKIEPLAVIDCNEHKARVDLFDQIVSYRAVEHKTLK
jgi:hypothetical protein